MRIPVRMQREIARLHFHCPSQSNRNLARAVGLAPNTVVSLRKKLIELKPEWVDLQKLDDDAWRATLGTEDRSPSRQKVAPDYAWVHDQMAFPDATLEQIWEEFRGTRLDSVGYTQFTLGYRTWKKSQHVVMRLTHRPGSKIFVDFAGRTIEIIDIEGGPSSFAKIFIGVLGYSNYTFVYAVPSETLPDWVKCHQEMFVFFGGVAEWVVLDNLKSGVTKRTRDHISINPTYKECLAAYDTAALPAGPYKPREKAKAEVGVQIAQRFILFPLRHRKFYSIEELNEAIKPRLEALNSHGFKNMTGSRLQRFVDTERAALRPLPARGYEFHEWRHYLVVGQDHHVPMLSNFYSVPYALVGNKVDVKFTQNFVEIFHRGALVASHQRLHGRAEFSTNDEHRPVAHRRVLEGEPDALARWAEAVGPNAAKMIRHHLQDRSDLTNGLKAARAMRSLAREHSDERFEEVCRYALGLNITALRSIRSIFQTSTDKRPAKVVTNMPPREPHTNVRGADYYSH